MVARSTHPSSGRTASLLAHPKISASNGDTADLHAPLGGHGTLISRLRYKLRNAGTATPPNRCMIGGARSSRPLSTTAANQSDTVVLFNKSLLTRSRTSRNNQYATREFQTSSTRLSIAFIPTIPRLPPPPHPPPSQHPP